ncbi:MAG: EamA-like transporter family protein [Fibrobacteres bacterium]|nr:EamA-like transporter family protein [Fibrobacterota bacterium]
MASPAVLIPFAAALLFPFATMALKRAMDLARDPWGTVFVSNAAIAAVFLPLFLFEERAASQGNAWQLLLSGAVFFLAQAAAYKSFSAGDLSVAVPAQGTKVLLVAVFTLLMTGQNVGVRLWGAAGMTVAAIWFLQDRESGGTRDRRRVLRTLAYAMAASIAFAAFDVFVQKWSPEWGLHRFGPWVFLCQALLSVSLLLLPCKGRRLRYDGRTWAWLAAGSAGMAVITLALVLTIGIYGKATLVNILFNSRCVSSVAFVWLAGRWFGNREAKSGRRAMGHRLLGAGFMMAAIALAMSGK